MATKTISIDLEAYSRLKKAKQKNESFSQVIKRQIRPAFDVNAWIKKLESLPMDDKAAEAVEKQIANRHKPGKH